MKRDDYLQLRNKYHPEKLKLIFILESPPVSGKYFYDDETGKTSEPLFNEMMKLMNYGPDDKKDGLSEFKKKGYLLVDATYKQVNNLKGKERENTILSDFDNLVADLEEICSDKKVPIVLVKVNICRLLENRLIAKDFNIKNNGIEVPFPSTGQQKRFHSKISKIFNERL